MPNNSHINDNDLRAKLRSIIIEYLANFDTMTDGERGYFCEKLLETSPDPSIVNYIEDMECFDGEVIVPPLEDIEQVLDRVMSHKPDIIFL